MNIRIVYATISLVAIAWGCTQNEEDPGSGGASAGTAAGASAGTAAGASAGAAAGASAGTVAGASAGTSAGAPAGTTSPGDLTLESFCSSLNDLSTSKGCTEVPVNECSSGFEVNCLAEGVTVLDCFARNAGGCYCEMDGKMNCEGTYKEDQAPEIGTPCLTAMEALRACLSIYEGGDEAGYPGGEPGGYAGGYAAGDIAGVEAGEAGGYAAGVEAGEAEGKR